MNSFRGALIPGLEHLTGGRMSSGVSPISRRPNELSPVWGCNGVA